MPAFRSSRWRGRSTRPRDPLQVNLRRVVWLMLLLVVVPTVILTGLGIVLLFVRDDPADLVLSLLVVAFAASVVAGATLLVILAGRGARLARIQETFLSRVGHELMTPIAGIRLHAQILAAGDLPAPARSSLESILRESSRLERLVERIVRWREVRSRRHLYLERPVRAVEIAERALATLPDATGIELVVRCPEAILLADRDALAEALSNLLQNARKYAGSDRVVLTVRQLMGRVVFDVADRGPGLPPLGVDDLARPFVRWVADHEPDPGGTGLGLAVARQIARDHGGELGAAPRPHGGARFFLALPVRDVGADLGGEAGAEGGR